MPDQLDLFSTLIAGEKEPEASLPVTSEGKIPATPEMPLTKAPVEGKGRELLKDEALKIAGAKPAKVTSRAKNLEINEKPPVAVPELKTKPRGRTPAHPAGKRTEPVKTGTRGRKSIKEMSMEADLPEIPEDGLLYSKQYYGIGEVASMFKVNASLLRYWESEFDILKPKKNGKGDRFFRPDDIKNLQLIHHLLRQKKFTIEGAREYLRNNKRSTEKFEMVRQLEQLKRFLLEMKAGL